MFMSVLQKRKFNFLKTWFLVRIVERSKAVDLAAMRAAAKALDVDAELG